LPKMQYDQDSREATEPVWRIGHDYIGRSVRCYWSCCHGAVPLVLTANPSAAKDRVYKNK
jgi:hypothetical protein